MIGLIKKFKLYFNIHFQFKKLFFIYLILRRRSIESWNGNSDLPQDVLVKKILAANEQPAPESYPGYKKGTKSFAGMV